MSNTICPQCNNENKCIGNENCWCNNFPAIITPQPGSDCYCSSCLLEHVVSKANDLISDKQYEVISALGPVTQPIANLDFTINSVGNMVFTPWYHLRRGACCDNGCLNCPY